jgi:hypothetical protein
VITHAAATYDEVAFIISLVGPTTSVRTNMKDNAYHIYRCEDFTGDDLQQKIDQKARMAEVGVTLGNITRFGMLHHTALLLTYDPADDLLSTGTPSLFIYAENDDQVTPDLNLERLDELYDGNVPDHLTTHVLAGTTHAFRLVDDPCDSWVDVREQPRSEELGIVLNDWLTAQEY